MHQCNVIVASDNIPKSRKAFFYALHLNVVRQTVSQVLQFHIARRIRYKQPIFVAHCQSTDDAAAVYACVNYWNSFAQFSFENAVEMVENRKGKLEGSCDRRNVSIFESIYYSDPELNARVAHHHHHMNS